MGWSSRPISRISRWNRAIELARLRDLRGDDLEGGQAAHEPMLGLEDPPPAACTQAIEDHVGAHDQAVGLVPQEAIRLEFRQDPLGDQTLGQGTRLGRVLAAADLAADLFELPVTQDARAPDQGKKVGRHDLGQFELAGDIHACISRILVSGGGMKALQSIIKHLRRMAKFQSVDRGSPPVGMHRTRLVALRPAAHGAPTWAVMSPEMPC